MMTDEEHGADASGLQPEVVLGNTFPRCDLDPTDAPREHMREMTEARQAAEQRGGSPTTLHGGTDHAALMRADLARIDAAHQTWLHERGEDD
jgi:hypothetical protein